MSAAEIERLRASVTTGLELVSIETGDGLFYFMLNTDGQFIDVNGQVWVGSTLFGASAMQVAIGGVAPAASLTMRFVPDPDGQDLIEQIRSLGADYIVGRLVRFYHQPLLSVDEFYAPTIEPELFLTREATSIAYGKEGAEQRTITLSMETTNRDRQAARGITMDRVGHERLLGSPNPSLEWRPTTNFEEELLFG